MKSFLDLVVANAASDSVTILVNQGNGAFAAAAPIPVGVQPIHVDPADLDNDRDLDLVACNSGSGSISIILNQPNGAFSDAIHLPVGGSPQSIAGWDMDGDADLDLVAVVDDEQLGPVIRILRNDTGSSGGPLAFTLLIPSLKASSRAWFAARMLPAIEATIWSR